MSADLLRRAAAKLREHAEAATPGPWEHVLDGPPSGSFMGCGQVITMGAEVLGGDIAGPTGDLYPRGGYSPRDDMALIALMHPPVALALAGLLDHLADDLSDAGDRVEVGGLARNEHGSIRFDWTAALLLARAILRQPEAGAE